jgi:hypothetical protein
MAELGSVTALITAAGSVIGLANKTNTVESNQKIIELQQRMAEVQQGFAELFQENQDLKEANRKLHDEINAEEMYPLRQSARWKKSAVGGEDDGPFCPVCFASKKVLMPLKFRNRMGGPSSHLVSFQCPESQSNGRAREIEPIYHIEEASIQKGRYRFDF